QQQHALPGADLRRTRRRLGEGARHGVRPGGWHEADPWAAGDGGDRGLNQIGEHAIGAAHRAVCVHDADRLGDGVDGLLPFALGGREELHQAGILERDPRLSEHRGDERQLGFPQHAGPLARKGDRTHRAPARDQGRAEPGAGGSRVVGQGRPAPPGFFPYVLGERERPPPQRELEPGVGCVRRTSCSSRSPWRTVTLRAARVTSGSSSRRDPTSCSTSPACSPPSWPCARSWSRRRRCSPTWRCATRCAPPGSTTERWPTTWPPCCSSSAITTGTSASVAATTRLTTIWSTWWKTSWGSTTPGNGPSCCARISATTASGSRGCFRPTSPLDDHAKGGPI